MEATIMYMPKSAQPVNTQPQSGYMPKSAVLVPQQEKTIGGFLGNVVGSTGRLIGDTANAFIHPIDTVKGILATVQNPQALIDYYSQRYGKDFWNTLYTDPAGVAADLSVVLGGGGAILKGVGEVAKVGGLARAGEMIGNASRIVDPLNVASKAEVLNIKSPVSNVFRKVGTSLENAGENVATRGIGNPAMQADMASKAGRSVASFIDQYNQWDRSPESARRVKNLIGNKYDELVMASDKMVPTQSILDKFDEQIASLNNGSGQFSDSTQSQVAELQRRKLQFMASVTDFEGNIPKEISVGQVTDFRRNAVDPDVPMSMYNLDARGSGTAKGAKATRDLLRSTINSTDPALEGLGKDYGMAKGLEKVFKRSSSRAGNRQLISPSKMWSSGVGGVIGGIPGAVAGYATDAITTDPRFLKATSKTLTAVGGAIKDAKLPPVPAYANTSLKAAKVARVINPPSSTKQSGKPQTTQGGLMPKVDLTPQTNSTSQSYPSIASPKITPFKLKIKR